MSKIPRPKRPPPNRLNVLGNIWNSQPSRDANVTNLAWEWEPNYWPLNE